MTANGRSFVAFLPIRCGFAKIFFFFNYFIFSFGSICKANTRALTLYPKYNFRCSCFKVFGLPRLLDVSNERRKSQSGILLLLTMEKSECSFGHIWIRPMFCPELQSEVC